MAIVIEQIKTERPEHIGHDPSEPLLEGDSYDEAFTIAENFELDGTPINPADFTADGGWLGSVTVQGAAFTVSISTLDATGSYTLTIDEDDTLTFAGTHRYNVLATNVTLSKKRTIQKGTITIKERFIPLPP